MNSYSTAALETKRSWHLWVVGVMALLWYASGAYTIGMAQAGKLPDLSAGEIAYYAAQPVWLALLTDISLCSALMASVALLLKHRMASTLFRVSLTTILLTNIYDLSAGTARELANTGAMVATIIIVVIAVLLVFYSGLMKWRGVLK